MKIEITEHTIQPPVSDSSDRDTGAELIFRGIVRNVENGMPIIALDYEHYHGMAELKLQEIARITIDKFKIQDIDCTHRSGPVTVGDVAVQIVIRSRHRKEALLAMDWFISEMKKEVPIWKWGITQDGDRFPSDTKLK